MAVPLAAAAMGMGLLLSLLFQRQKVLVVFQYKARRLPEGFRGQLSNAQGIQRRSPVQGFRKGGLLQNGLGGTKLLHRQRHLGRQAVVHMGQLLAQNGQFLLHIGIVDVQVGAPAAQGLG